MSLSPTSGYCFFISKQKKTFCPRIFKKYFCFYKDQDDEYYQINKNKTRLFFIRNFFFWLRYSLKLSSWFQEECLLSSWKKNSWLKNVTILGTVSVQFRNECHGQRFILFPSSLCTFSHRLTNKFHKEGSKHFAEMPTWISGHTVFTISCRDISRSFSVMISTKTTCIWLLNPLRFFFFRTWISNFFLW